MCVDSWPHGHLSPSSPNPRRPAGARDAVLVAFRGLEEGARIDQVEVVGPFDDLRVAVSFIFAAAIPLATACPARTGRPGSNASDVGLPHSSAATSITAPVYGAPTPIVSIDGHLTTFDRDSSRIRAESAGPLTSTVAPSLGPSTNGSSNPSPSSYHLLGRPKHRLCQTLIGRAGSRPRFPRADDIPLGLVDAARAVLRAVVASSRHPAASQHVGQVDHGVGLGVQMIRRHRNLDGLAGQLDRPTDLTPPGEHATRT